MRYGCFSTDNLSDHLSEMSIDEAEEIQDFLDELNKDYEDKVRGMVKKGKIKINDIVSTLLGYPKGYEESREFLNRLQNSTSYGIKDGNKLRLYSSKDEYLYFEAMEKPWYIEQ